MDISSLGPLPSVTKLQQQKDVAVLKMANDQMKQEGKNAIQLIQSVPNASPGGPVGSKLDVFA
jgi:hypothetical protein